jgi:hypothetical protein
MQARYDADAVMEEELDVEGLTREVYTRARCYSSLAFLVTMGILHINEI